ncbi:MAG: 5-(carboxyamino)imidazole ribonucleotide synthase [Polyangiaceae bacterium]
MSRPIMPASPRSTIGVFGGGQLGRMMAMAAREMGFRVRAVDPDGGCAARFVVVELIVAPLDDVDAAELLARASAVGTLEIERVSTAGLERARERVPVRPSAGVLEIIQDRAKQKNFLTRAGLPVGPFRVADTAEELAEHVAALGGKTFVKVAFGGYDGRGQYETSAVADAAAAARELGLGPGKRVRCVVERALDIEAELSVMVARRPSGEVAVYPPALNHHVARILSWSVLPAPIEPRLSARAVEIARTIASALDVEGLLCVELFVVGGELLVNELAPRPHNSYHASVVASATSQFEQHVRAVCDLPLGSTEIVRPAAIANILGDAWLTRRDDASGEPAERAKSSRPPPFDRVLALPGVRLHLYGKSTARPGRKMGHISASAATPEEAIALVQRASALLESS